MIYGRRYFYAVDEHYLPPFEYTYNFSNRVESGWRLVSVVKEAKDRFYSYWEKEVD